MTKKRPRTYEKPLITLSKVDRYCKYCGEKLDRSAILKIFRYDYCNKAHKDLHTLHKSTCKMCHKSYSSGDSAPFCSEECETTFMSLDLPLQARKTELYEEAEAKLLEAVLNDFRDFLDNVCKRNADDLRFKSLRAR